MNDHMDARVLFILLAARKVGDYLYSWGGESAKEGGYDCSGYVSTVLAEAARSYPSFYDGGRRTAQGIYDYFKSRGCPQYLLPKHFKPGTLVFYHFPGRRIHHVAIHAMNVPPLHGRLDIGPVAFESGGSGSAATSPRNALIASAGIRMTASDTQLRGVVVRGIDPFYSLD